MREVYWRIFINSKNKRKAEEISNNVINILGNCKEVSLEIYWKDKSMYCLELKQSLLIENPQQILLVILSKIVKFSNTWILEIPDDFENNDFDFSGVSDDSIKINNLNWISFSLETSTDI